MEYIVLTKDSKNNVQVFTIVDTLQRLGMQLKSVRILGICRCLACEDRIVMGKTEYKEWCSLWIPLLVICISTIAMMGIFVQAGQL